MPHRPRVATTIVLLFGSALVLCLLGYLALAVPASWFPTATVRDFGARDLTLARGTGAVTGNELVITGVDATGNALVTLNSNFRSGDYAAVAWIASDLPDGADARLFWRNDYRPDKLNAAPIIIDGGHALPVVLAGNPDWIGRVTGLALAIHSGTLTKPVRVRGAAVKPMGAAEMLSDRAGEWLAFEGWNGASINTIAGGADIQDLPLPMLLAAALVLAGAIWFALAARAFHRRRPSAGRNPARYVRARLARARRALDMEPRASGPGHGGHVRRP